MNKNINEDKISQIEELILRGEKTAAIKLLKDTPEISLKDTLEIIKRIQPNLSEEIDTQLSIPSIDSKKQIQPKLFEHRNVTISPSPIQPKGGSNKIALFWIFFLVIAGIIIYIAVHYFRIF